MRNLKLTLAYDGSCFAGWQRQPKPQRTVQGELEDKLAIICAGPVTVHGAGRTDAGVHALAMVANFHCPINIPCQGLQKGLNSLLGADLRVLAVEEVADHFHARISARQKSYCYHFSTAPIQLPTQRLYEAHPGKLPCLAAMQQCLAEVTGTHDYSAFEAVGSRDPSYTAGKGAVRTIFQAQMAELAPDRYCLTLVGDGFLRKMVRNIMGTLFEVGKGRISPARFKEILAAGDRSQAGPTAPACGLFLVEIDYGSALRTLR